MKPRVVMWVDMGFCPGVERAMSLLEQALRAYGTVFTLGPIIHNPRVIQELEHRGARALEDVSQARGNVLVLRTHGVGPRTLEEARQTAKVVVDATCPYVKRAQRAARALAKEDRQVLIVGDPLHPEVTALLEWVGEQGRAVEGEHEAKLLAAQPGPRRLGVVGQTTLDKEFFWRIVETLKSRGSDVKVVDTLCPVTAKRQAAAARLARYCNGVVVVGGKSSANTRRLAKIAAEEGAKSVLHVEGREEIAPSWWDGKTVVGVVGGASTPRDAVFQVAQHLAGLGGRGSRAFGTIVYK